MTPWNVEIVTEDDGTITAQIRHDAYPHVARFGWRRHGTWQELERVGLVFTDGRPEGDGVGWLAVNFESMRKLAWDRAVRHLEEVAKASAPVPRLRDIRR